MEHLLAMPATRPGTVARSATGGGEADAEGMTEGFGSVLRAALEGRGRPATAAEVDGEPSPEDGELPAAVAAGSSLARLVDVVTEVVSGPDGTVPDEVVESELQALLEDAAEIAAEITPEIAAELDPAMLAAAVAAPVEDPEATAALRQLLGEAMTAEETGAAGSPETPDGRVALADAAAAAAAAVAATGEEDEAAPVTSAAPPVTGAAEGSPESVAVPGGPAPATTEDGTPQLRDAVTRIVRAVERDGAEPRVPVSRSEPTTAGEIRAEAPLPESSLFGSSRTEGGRAALPPGVQRVLEAVTQLEKMPPPRQLVLEMGDLRVRVGLEDGQIRLTVLAGSRADADELLADARDALAQHGFDLAGGSGGDRDDDPDDHPFAADGPERPTARVRHEPDGLRL